MLKLGKNEVKNELFETSKNDETGFGTKPTEKKALITQYLGISPFEFFPTDPQTDRAGFDYQNGSFRGLAPSGVSSGAQCPVHLEDGAIIKAFIVYGSDTGTGFYLWKRKVSDATPTQIGGTANVGTEVTGVNEVVNNKINHYFLTLDQVNSTKSINGARITYLIEGR